MPAKNRYMIDDKNRLLIKQNRRSLLADGRFAVDKNNRLNFWLNEPVSWRREYNLPGKIRFSGNWRLSTDCDLKLVLDETEAQHKGDSLVFRGEIISTDRDALVFQLQRQDRQGQSHFQLLELSGSWNADEHNRITFSVKRKDEPDILVLAGIWQLNKNQQIIYAYEKTYLKRKTKSVNTLTFTGFWQINGPHRLTYILSRSQDSRFDFRVQAESPNLYPQQGLIKYRLGIGLQEKGRRLVKERMVCLYGNWKFSRKMGLLFQMDCGKGKIRNIEFQADISVNQRNKIEFSLKDRKGAPLGLNIAFTHRFLKKLDAEAFIRLKGILQEKPCLTTGVRIPF